MNIDPPVPDDAAAWVRRLGDPEGFVEWDTDLQVADPSAFVDRMPHRGRLAEAPPHTNANAAVLTGVVSVNEMTLALVVSRFSFQAGTLGVVSGERIARAFRRAAEAELPLLAITRSGGVRMQEGTAGFAQMLKITEAVAVYKRGTKPFIVYLADPTTGGVLASYGSLGHITWAQPAALISFAGPRATTTREPMASTEPVAENLARHGLVDDLVDVADIPSRVRTVLRLFTPTISMVAKEPLQDAPTTVEAWEAVRLTRDEDRPGARDLLALCADTCIPLRGDRNGQDDPTCLTTLASIGGRPVVCIAQDRDSATRGRMTVGGYRKARRALAIAAGLRLPVITIVDTPGPVEDASSVEQGIAAQIAGCVHDLITHPVATVSVLLGQGSGGGALALLPADQTLAPADAWLAPIAPEAASTILFKTAAKAPRVAREQRICATDLRELGIVDRVCDALADPKGLKTLADLLTSDVSQLGAHDLQTLRERRSARYHSIGQGERTQAAAT